MPTLMGKVHPAPPIIKVTGTPFEMGKQHGVLLKPLILEFIENSKKEYQKLNIPDEKITKLISNQIDYFRQIMPERIEELEGMAAGIKVDFDIFFTAYFSYEIYCAQPLDVILSQVYHKEKGCTAYAATKDATLQNKSFIGMNTDSSQTSMRFRTTIVATPTNGYRYISHARATDNGGYGVNEKGVSLVAPTVFSRDSSEAFQKGKLSGFFDRAITRTVLGECANLDEAIVVAKQLPGAYQGLNIIIMDGKGDMAKIERSYSKFNIIYPEDDSSSTTGILAATNHYASPKMNPMGPIKSENYRSSYQRYARITELLELNQSKIDLIRLQSFTRDHIKHPDHSICRHGDPMCTNCAMIVETKPPTRHVWILTGTPCENQYNNFALS